MVQAPQTYTVECIIAGGIVDAIAYFYESNNQIDHEIKCINPTNGFTCISTLNNNNPEEVSSNITPDPLRLGTLSITWTAKLIDAGIFAQANNDGDHRIKCQAMRLSTMRNSPYIIVKGI